MSETKKRKKPPTAKQLRARAKFARMAKLRAKEARARKRLLAAKKKPVKRGKKNSTIVKAKRIDHVDVAKVHNPVKRELRSQAARLARAAKELEAQGYTVKKTRQGQPGLQAGIRIKRGQRAGKPGYTWPTKRNAEHRDAQHPIHVRQYWQGRAGYKSQWQRAHEAGQRQLFGVKNPGDKAFIVEVTPPAGQGEKFTTFNHAPTAGIAKSRVMQVLRALHGRQASKWKIKITESAKNGSPGRRRTAKAKYSNGSAAAKRREWAGTSGKVTNSYAPKGSGVKGTVIKMGELKKLYIKGRAPLSFPTGAAMLAYAPKASKRKDQMVVLGKKYRFKMKRRNPEGLEDLGEITQIEYIETKQQFGDREPVIYYHKLGEEGGERPHAVINEEGLLLIEGGDYTITPEGIRD